MNTVSGEFESGTIVPLLTKPVSKTLVFAAKIVASVITLLASYTILVDYIAIGGTLIDGPQDNLSLVPLGILGLTVGSMVWASVALTLGTLSKNSVLAALGSFGFYIGLLIGGTLIAAQLGASTVLFYAPGMGATGTTAACAGLERGGGQTFSTGTDGLASMLMRWVLNPGQVLNFCGFQFPHLETQPRPCSHLTPSQMSRSEISGCLSSTLRGCCFSAGLRFADPRLWNRKLIGFKV